MIKLLKWSKLSSVQGVWSLQCQQETIQLSIRLRTRMWRLIHCWWNQVGLLPPPHPPAAYKAACRRRSGKSRRKLGGRERIDDKDDLPALCWSSHKPQVKSTDTKNLKSSDGIPYSPYLEAVSEPVTIRLWSKYAAPDSPDCDNVKNDRPGDDGTLRSVKLLVFLLGVIDLASASA